MKPNTASIFRILGVIPDCLQEMNPAQVAQLRALWTPLATNYAINVNQLSDEELIKRFEDISNQLQQIVKMTPLLCEEFTDFANHTRFNSDDYIADQNREDILRNTTKIANEIIRLQVEMEKDNLEQAEDQN